MWIEVQRVSGDGMSRQRYVFTVGTSSGDRTIRVQFSSYFDEMLPSRRHRNWNVVEMWDVHERRPRHRVRDAAPTVPDDVKSEVISRLTAEIKFNNC